MSRSYKKTPVSKLTDKNWRKEVKKVANRRVRHHKGSIPNGRWFCRLFNSYIIDDHFFVCTSDEYEEIYDSKLDWEKYHKRK